MGLVENLVDNSAIPIGELINCFDNSTVIRQTLKLHQKVAFDDIDINGRFYPQPRMNYFSEQNQNADYYSVNRRNYQRTPGSEVSMRNLSPNNDFSNRGLLRNNDMDGPNYQMSYDNGRQRYQPPPPPNQIPQVYGSQLIYQPVGLPNQQNTQYYQHLMEHYYESNFLKENSNQNKSKPKPAISIAVPKNSESSNKAQIKNQSPNTAKPQTQTTRKSEQSKVNDRQIVKPNSNQIKSDDNSKTQVKANSRSINNDQGDKVSSNVKYGNKDASSYERIPNDHQTFMDTGARREAIDADGSNSYDMNSNDPKRKYKNLYNNYRDRLGMKRFGSVNYKYLIVGILLLVFLIMMFKYVRTRNNAQLNDVDDENGGEVRRKRSKKKHRTGKSKKSKRKTRKMVDVDDDKDRAPTRKKSRSKMKQKSRKEKSKPLALMGSSCDMSNSAILPSSVPNGSELMLLDDRDNTYQLYKETCEPNAMYDYADSVPEDEQIVVIEPDKLKTICADPTVSDNVSVMIRESHLITEMIQLKQTIHCIETNQAEIGALFQNKFGQMLLQCRNEDKPKQVIFNESNVSNIVKLAKSEDELACSPKASFTKRIVTKRGAHKRPFKLVSDNENVQFVEILHRLRKSLSKNRCTQD